MRPELAVIKFFTCAVCGALQEEGWRHDTEIGSVCPNCWVLFVIGGKGCGHESRAGPAARRKG